MSVINLTCRYCRHEAPLSMFETVVSNRLKCMRCRNAFDDPNAYAADTAYADCDNQHAVTRFPFSLNGRTAVIHVRDGYRACVIGNDKREIWLDPGDHLITDKHDGFRLYYICLTPWVFWGVKGTGGFGAYGRAQLSITNGYVEKFCGMGNSVTALEKHAKALVDGRIATYVREEIARHNTSLLERRDGYLDALGILEDGVTLRKIDPMGYRSGNGHVGTFPTYPEYDDSPDVSALSPALKAPVDYVKLPKRSYTVKSGVEEVFLRSASKADRHKAGEMIELDACKGIEKILRFHTKEFDFPYGWGLSNQTYAAPGYFSAHGTISFFIDSTERLSLLLAKAADWKDFSEQFFRDVLRNELSDALRATLSAYMGRTGFDRARINSYLSEMSVALTSRLNGEDAEEREPVFRRYGLRVSRIDILSMDFYSNRR